jgi:hypothetical protein
MSRKSFPDHCDTCGRDVKDTKDDPRLVFSMPAVTMSVGLCKECYDQDAYPLDIVDGVVEMNGGQERTAGWFLKLYA